MLFPVLPRVAGVSFPPLPPAIPDYLGILPIRLHLLAVVVRAPPALAVRLPAHTLVRAVLGWLKRLLAIATATGWQAGSSEVLESPLEENRKQMPPGTSEPDVDAIGPGAAGPLPIRWVISDEHTRDTSHERRRALSQLAKSAMKSSRAKRSTFQCASRRKSRPPSDFANACHFFQVS